MTLEQLLAFAQFAYVSSATPGPNNVLLTAVGGAVGVRRGLPVLWGIAIGFAAMLFILGLGIGETLFSIPYVKDAMRIAGFAVLAWLAWQIATRSGRARAPRRARKPIRPPPTPAPPTPEPPTPAGAGASLARPCSNG